VLVLREVLAQQLGDGGGAASGVGVGDQRLIDRDLVVLGLAGDREDQYVGKRVVALFGRLCCFRG
jgi:hypothetical protein